MTDLFDRFNGITVQEHQELEGGMNLFVDTNMRAMEAAAEAQGFNVALDEYPAIERRMKEIFLKYKA